VSTSLARTHCSDAAAHHIKLVQIRIVTEQVLEASKAVPIMNDIVISKRLRTLKPWHAFLNIYMLVTATIAARDNFMNYVSADVRVARQKGNMNESGSCMP
jgi:hypothetical protein